jgi:hypothetical protein
MHISEGYLPAEVCIGGYAIASLNHLVFIAANQQISRSLCWSTQGSSIDGGFFHCLIDQNPAASQ